MIVTLFGITVITFIVTRLAPGDPAAMRAKGAVMGGGRGQQLSEEIIEENRRILGLDKPVVFNLHPKGRAAHAREAVEDLGALVEYVVERAQEKLRRVKAAALPEVMTALGSTTSATMRRRLLQILPTLTGATSPSDTADRPLDERADWWLNWWDENRGRFTPENAKAVVQEYFEDPTPENFHRVAALSGFAVPFIMDRIDTRDRETSDHATALLTEIIARPWNNLEVESDEMRRRNINRWQRWWRYHRAEFVEFGPVERFFRAFSDTQYGIWVAKIMRFDFDESYTQRRPVLDIIKERLPISVQLSLISIFLSYLISIPLGIFSATHQYKLSDKLVTTLLFIIYSLPSFWVADMLILFVTKGGVLYNAQQGFWGNVFPVIFFPVQGLHSPGAENLTFWAWLGDWVWHLALPITCLTYTSLAFLSRQMRVAMLETVRQDFIRTAQAKGLSQRAVILKHALRNSLIPILTLMASLLPELIGGSIIIETIFGIPGMGKLTFEAIIARDYPVVNAVAFFAAFLTLLGILISDLSYALADPRIRYE